MAKDINKDKFPEETKLKLEIFSECFREWFPVFIHGKYYEKVFIYDFFAGSGKDPEGSLGSPLILLKEAKGEDCKCCSQVRNNGKPISFIFNEKEKRKQKELEENVTEFMNRCLFQNCKQSQCVYDFKNFSQMEFKDIFQDTTIQKILMNKSYGKFVLLDQYGFSQIDEDIFKQLVNAPTTDFIFFISSSEIRRFKAQPAVKQYFDTEKIHFDETKPNECHRIIAQYYRAIIPKGKEYYLHHFTIQKGTNYRGLIFGTNHTLGMEKFLKVCWNKDEQAGESNCNIYNDDQEGSLFYVKGETVKKTKIEIEIRSRILSGEISNNIAGFRYALEKGCLPALFTSVVKKLEAEKKVTRTGDLNYKSTSIHKVKRYEINVT